jgi:porin
MRKELRAWGGWSVEFIDRWTPRKQPCPMKTRLLFALIALFGSCQLRAGENAVPPKAQPSPTESATLFPIPDLTSSFWTRQRLLGTIFGPRETLADHGVQFNFNMTHTYQDVFSGGDTDAWSQRVTDSVDDKLKELLTRGLNTVEESGSPFGRALTFPLPQRGDVTLGDVLQERIDRLDLGAPSKSFDNNQYQGSWRLELELDTQKMGLWPGGFFFMRAEQNYGDSIDDRSGVLLPPDVNATLPVPNYHGVSIPHMYFTQFLAPKVAVVVGRLDATQADANEFAHIGPDDQFIGTAFSANPVAALLGPYSSLGASILLLPTKDLVTSVGAFDGDGVSTRSGFDTLFKGKSSYLMENRLTTHFFDKPGHQLLGIVYGNGNYNEFNFSLNSLAQLRGFSLPSSNDSWALYYNFDQYFWQPKDDPGHGWGAFGRVGLADPSTNPISQFYSFGFGGKGLADLRLDDKWGVGWYYMQTSNYLPAFLHLGHEQGFEAYYDFAVTPAFLVTADLQVTNSAKEGVGTTVIGGLRATLRF